MNLHDRQVINEAFNRAIDPKSCGEKALRNVQYIRYIFGQYGLAMDDRNCQNLLAMTREGMQTLQKNRALQAASETYLEAQLLIEIGEPATAALARTKNALREAADTDGYDLDQAYAFLGTNAEEFETLLNEHGIQPQRAGVVMQIIDGVPQLTVVPGGLRLF